MGIGAKKSSRWLPGLRALLSIGRELRLLRMSVERLADAYEGKSPLVELPPAEEPPPAIEYDRDRDYGRQYQIELRLERQLGRRPTPDEIIRELDGEEADSLNPQVVAGRRQPELDLGAR